MRQEDRIVFLGTGGGKGVMFTQVRKTGGIYVKMDDTGFIIDPGPGSLVYVNQLKLKPEKLDGIILSHLHPDHSSDADALLDGMKNPFLIAEEHCLKPSDNYYPCISSYHQEKARIYRAVAGKGNKIKNIKVRSVRADHYAPTVGFVIEGTKKIGYAADGTYYKGQGKAYDACDILILNVLVPKGEKAILNKHMSVDGAIKLIKEIKNKPKLVIIQHFSFWMLRSGIPAQAKAIKDATGVRTIAARDFMELEL